MHDISYLYLKIVKQKDKIKTLLLLLLSPTRFLHPRLMDSTDIMNQHAEIIWSHTYK